MTLLEVARTRRREHVGWLEAWLRVRTRRAYWQPRRVQQGRS
ncbi:hypothetical protein [Nocardioides pakistanensis]